MKVKHRLIKNARLTPCDLIKFVIKNARLTPFDVIFFSPDLLKMQGLPLAILSNFNPDSSKMQGLPVAILSFLGQIY